MCFYVNSYFLTFPPDAGHPFERVNVPLDTVLMLNFDFVLHPIFLKLAESLSVSANSFLMLALLCSALHCHTQAIIWVRIHSFIIQSITPVYILDTHIILNSILHITLGIIIREQQHLVWVLDHQS